MRMKTIISWVAVMLLIATLPQVFAYDLTEDPGIKVWEKYEKAGILTPDNKSMTCTDF